MITEPTNRITALLDSPSPTSRRSPAQQAASRRNGAKSRGPTTTRGKLKSRLNSLKHGLLAKTVAPPVDAEEQHRQYHEIRQALVEQFRPSSFTDNATIDVLAHDYVLLGHAARLLKWPEKPSLSDCLAPGDLEKWQGICDRRRNLELAEKVFQARELGKCPRLSPEDSKVLAAIISAAVRDWLAPAEEEAESPADDTAPDDQADEAPSDTYNDEFEVERERKYHEMVAALSPAATRLRDQSYVTAVLSGGHSTDPDDLYRTYRLLDDLKERWEVWLFALRGLETEINGLKAKLEADESSDQSVEELMLLRRYQQQIERSIERKIQQLRGR